MNHQWEREIYLIAAVLLSFGASPSRASAAECAQSAIQAISPSNSTIVSATPQSDPGYCDVIAYVTTFTPDRIKSTSNLHCLSKGMGDSCS